MFVNLNPTIHPEHTRTQIQRIDRDESITDLRTSEQCLTHMKEHLKRNLPRPKSGEFRALFEGNTP